jgi:hypothetical protein
VRRHNIAGTLRVREGALRKTVHDPLGVGNDATSGLVLERAAVLLAVRVGTDDYVGDSALELLKQPEADGTCRQLNDDSLIAAEPGRREVPTLGRQLDGERLCLRCQQGGIFGRFDTSTGE